MKVTNCLLIGEALQVLHEPWKKDPVIKQAVLMEQHVRVLFSWLREPAGKQNMCDDDDFSNGWKSQMLRMYGLFTY